MNAKQLLIRLLCAGLLSCVLFGCTPDPEDESGTGENGSSEQGAEADSDAYTGDGIELPEIPFH